jgi:hypothetical protein
MNFRHVLAASAIGITAVCAPAAHASYVDTFQGVTFTVDIVDADTFTFRIQNALSTTDPNWSSATRLGAFSFKDIGLDFSSVTGSSTYLGATATGIRAELNNGVAANSAIDCTAITGPGQTGSICFDYNPDTALTDNMLFTLDFSAPFTFSSEGPHLKIMFVNNNLNKVGDLYSQNIPGNSVPEPATAALIGVGLLGLAATRRRKQA